MHSAKRHINRRGPDAHIEKPLSHLRQPGRDLDLAAVLPRDGVFVTAPPDLARGARPRPDDAVEGDGIDRLGPYGNLPAQDQLRLLFWEAVSRVVGVNQAPALGRPAPVIEWVQGFESFAVVGVDPLASTAVQVL